MSEYLITRKGDWDLFVQCSPWRDVPLMIAVGLDKYDILKNKLKKLEV